MVDPRAEAEARTGGRFAVRVLEPSPAGFDRVPWFADDPVDAPVAGNRPVVSPVGNGDLTWDRLATDEPDLAPWCADRWLGAWRRLEPIDDIDAFRAARAAMHMVAEHVLAPARHTANGRIGLRFARSGFATPFFLHDGHPTQLRVDGLDLVTATGATDTDTTTEVRAPLSSAVASETTSDAWNSTPKRAGMGYELVTTWEPARLGDLDAGAAAQLADWFGFAWSVLEELRHGQPDAGATRVQLWPEHFDASIELGDEAAGGRGTFGASPGDAAHPEPYFYVTHWDAVAPDPYWNDASFPGASLPLADLVAATDQRGAALAFLRAGRARFERPSTRSS